MITVTITTGAPDIQVAYNGNVYYFPATSSKSDYTLNNDAITLQCPPIGLNLVFPSNAYDFIIDGVAWVGTFANLSETLNKNVFVSTMISPTPGTSATIRANAITTGAYVATSALDATGRAQVHFDFNITDGGALANSGCIIAIVQASDDGVSWVNLNNVVAGSALVADGAGTAFEAGSVFRPFVAEYAATTIPYDSSNLPSLPIRISYSTGYGRFYRLQVRASDTGGISTGAPGTFPDLEIKASLQ